MKCPSCKNKSTRVLDSRESQGGMTIRRRRECSSCGHRFTTFERIEHKSLIVIKRNDSREPYRREKVESGIWRACEKRPVTQSQVDDLITSLEDKWRSYGKEIPSEMIGQHIMEELKKLDEVAYIRFASVYRHFKDVDSFKKELETLKSD